MAIQQLKDDDAKLVSQSYLLGSVEEAVVAVVVNALEHARGLTCVQVRLDLGDWAFSVQDDGCGIEGGKSGLELLGKVPASRDPSISRGVSLSALGSLSHLQITSKTSSVGIEQGAELLYGKRSRADGDVIGSSSGTLVTVRQLFFNIPVRRRVLVHNRPNWKALLEGSVKSMLQRLALLHPHISWIVSTESCVLFRAPCVSPASSSGSWWTRAFLTGVLGPRIAARAFLISSPNRLVSLVLWPIDDWQALEPSRRLLQIVAVGHQWIRSRELEEHLFARLERIGRLLVTSSQRTIRPLYIAVLHDWDASASIPKSLGKAIISPIDLDVLDLNVPAPYLEECTTCVNAFVSSEYPHLVSVLEAKDSRKAVESKLLSHGLEIRSRKRRRWRLRLDESFDFTRGLAPLIRSVPTPTQSLPPKNIQPMSLNRHSKVAMLDAMALSSESIRSMEYLGRLNDEFIIALLRSCTARIVIAVDQHAADERIQLEALQNSLEKSVAIHSFSKPQVLRVDDRAKHLISVFNEDIARWGFNVKIHESGREHDVVLLSVPVVCGVKLDAASLVEYVTALPHACRPAAVDRILCMKACKSAIKFGDRLSKQHCVELLTNLAMCKFPFQCAHGRPSIQPLLALSRAP